MRNLNLVRKFLVYCLMCQYGYRWASSKQKVLLLIESDQRFIVIMTLLGGDVLKFSKLHFTDKSIAPIDWIDINFDNDNGRS